MDSGNLVPGAAPSFAATQELLAKQVEHLRDQFVAIAERLASTQEQMALYWEEAAKRHPSKADRYWRTAHDARENAQWVRQIAEHFADIL